MVRMQASILLGFKVLALAHIFKLIQKSTQWLRVDKGSPGHEQGRVPLLRSPFCRSLCEELYLLWGGYMCPIILPSTLVFPYAKKIQKIEHIATLKPYSL